jgi:hypothetical protein
MMSIIVGMLASVAVGYWLGKNSSNKTALVDPELTENITSPATPKPVIEKTELDSNTIKVFKRSDYEPQVLNLLSQQPPIAVQSFIDSKPVQNWGKANPADLMEWLTTAPVPQTPGGAPAGLKVAINEWSKKDINDCAEWLKAHPEYSAYDHAVRYLVEYMVPVDKDSAAAWAATIKDPAIAQKALSFLGNR